MARSAGPRAGSPRGRRPAAAGRSRGRRWSRSRRPPRRPPPPRGAPGRRRSLPSPGGSCGEVGGEPARDERQLQDRDRAPSALCRTKRPPCEAAKRRTSRQPVATAAARTSAPPDPGAASAPGRVEDRRPESATETTRRPARRRPSTTISGPPCSIALTIRLSTACSRAAASPSTTASPARQRSSSEPPPSATLACQRRTADRSGGFAAQRLARPLAAAAVDLPIEPLEGDRRQPRRARDDVAARAAAAEGKRLQRAAQLVQRLVDRGPLALRHPSISRYPTPQQLIT